MKVKDLMTKKVITIDKYDSIKKACEKLIDNDIGLLVIANEKREVIGVITDRDIMVRLVAKSDTLEKAVDDIMTHSAITIDKDDDITEALAKMKDYQLRRLPVINKKMELVGIITLSDLSICKQTNELINDLMYELSLPNPQKEKPLKYLRADDFPL